MIGAVVLLAAAVLLIPEMLSGPRTSAPAGESGSAAPEEDPAKLKTYTIDLSKTAASASGDQARSTSIPSVPSQTPSESPKVSTPALPVEELVVATSPTSKAESKVEQKTQLKPEIKPESQANGTTGGSQGNKADGVQKAAQSISRAETSRVPVVAAAPSGGWTVQVGSFGVRATSERVAADLKREGFPAFVVAFQSGNQTMYRVRVGPEKDRVAAEALLRKLKPLHASATLVAP